MARQPINPGQESVWDYPRLENAEGRIKAIYVPTRDIRMEHLRPSEGFSHVVGPIKGVPGTWGW